MTSAGRIALIFAVRLLRHMPLVNRLLSVPRLSPQGERALHGSACSSSWRRLAVLLFCR